MKPTNFTRDDCKLGNRRIRYQRLCRDYVCNECDEGLVIRWDDEVNDARPFCSACYGQDFVHEMQVAREKHQAMEVLDGLPQELADLMRGR